MKRWAAFGILAGSMVALSGSCQGPDAFYRPSGAGQGGRGGGSTGFGGFIGFGVGGSGMGGFIGSGVGGRGTGGALGTGGRGVGGVTGAAGTTGVDGGVGVGGTLGAGGRILDAGSGCIATLIDNGYAAGTATPCSMCIENGNSLTDKCTRMIDCLAPSCTSTTAGCFTDCLNSVSGSGPLSQCVRALVAAACGP